MNLYTQAALLSFYSEKKQSRSIRLSSANTSIIVLSILLHAKILVRSYVAKIVSS